MSLSRYEEASGIPEGCPSKGIGDIVPFRILPWLVSAMGETGQASNDVVTICLLNVS